MPLQQYLASSLVSVPFNTNLTNVSINQGEIFFDGNFKLNFSNALSGAADVCTKNYSNFYLTNKDKLSNYIDSKSTSLRPESLTTTIKVGSLYLSVIPSLSSNFINYDYFFNLQFTEAPIYNQYFEISFINAEYCTISYNDGSSLYYVVTDNDVCVLRKSVFLNSEFNPSSPQFFRYILNGNNIFLTQSTRQITSVLNSLSCVSSLGMSSNTFRENYFVIDNDVDISIRNKVSTDYINYNKTDLNIDIQNSQIDLENNYLLYRNLDKENINDINIILLKNQMSNNGKLVKGNNLSYYDNTKLTDLRTYTSIFNDIDTELEEGLELNYVRYNTSININPGVNRFTTGSSFSPFIQLNINDTTFIESGAFAFNTPQYADKVYSQDILSDGSIKTYLCTWLSGSPNNTQSVWVDRYYYPNLITKRAALSSTSAFTTTYNTYLESLITSSAALSSTVSTNYYFDKKSDMVFRPSTEYTYDRFDINSLDFQQFNIYGSDAVNYFNDINLNGGFTLQCTLICKQNEELNTIQTKYNSVEGGVNISYNDKTLFLNINLYDQSLDTYNIISTTANLLPNIDNNIILHVDSFKGIIYLYINGDLAFTSTFYSQYYKLLYGDFFANDQPLIEYVDFLDDVFLTNIPLTLDEVLLLSIKDIINFNDSYSINLPCGMKNSTDNISQLNSITINQKSKSNSIDLHISNLGITDSSIINDVKNVIQNNITDILPVNVNINQINILS